MSRNGRNGRNVSFDTGPMRTTSDQQTLTIDEQEQLHEKKKKTRGYYNPFKQTVHGFSQGVERPPQNYWQSVAQEQQARNEATDMYWRFGPGVYKTTTGQEFELREENAGNGLINVIACFATIGCGIILASIATKMFDAGAKKSKRKSKKGKSKKGKSKKGKSKKGKSKKGKSKRKY